MYPIFHQIWFFGFTLVLVPFWLN